MKTFLEHIDTGIPRHGYKDKNGGISYGFREVGHIFEMKKIKYKKYLKL